MNNKSNDRELNRSIRCSNDNFKKIISTSSNSFKNTFKPIDESKMWNFFNFKDSYQNIETKIVKSQNGFTVEVQHIARKRCNMHKYI